jgi:hypothetical protein
MALIKKSLTPSKFSLNTMNPFTSVEIETIVTKYIKTLNITPAAKEACNYIVKQSIIGSNSFPGKFDGLTTQDIGIITSDFGEVCGALYMLNSGQNYTHAKFPKDENMRLVDYYLVRDGIDEKFSAKSGEGGAPAITAVEGALNNINPESLSTINKKALTVLKLINKGTVYGGVLEVAKYLDLPGYNQLIKLIKRTDLKTGYRGINIPDQDVLINAVNAMGSYDSCVIQCKELFKAASFAIGSEAKMKSVFGGTASARYKKWGMIHFPITSEVMKWLNNPANGAIEVLTLAARTLTVNQINLDYKSSNLTYAVRTFSDATFKFHSPSSAPNPVGNRIGMKMIKTRIKKS